MLIMDVVCAASPSLPALMKQFVLVAILVQGGLSYSVGVTLDITEEGSAF